MKRKKPKKPPTPPPVRSHMVCPICGTKHVTPVISASLTADDPKASFHIKCGSCRFKSREIDLLPAFQDLPMVDETKPDILPS